MPFAFTFVAIDAVRHRRRPAAAALLGVSVVPTVLAAVALALAAGGPTIAWDTFVAAATQSRTNEYLLKFAGGPWYRYFVDHLVLSPWTTLGYVLWLGYALGTRLDDDGLRARALVHRSFCSA